MSNLSKNRIHRDTPCMYDRMMLNCPALILKSELEK